MAQINKVVEGQLTNLEQFNAVIQSNNDTDVASRNAVSVSNTANATSNSALSKSETALSTANSAVTQVSSKADKSNTYTKTEVDTSISTLNTTVQGKLDLKSDKSTTYTKTQVDESTTKLNTSIKKLSTDTTTSLGLKADKLTTYTKKAVDDSFVNLTTNQTINGMKRFNECIVAYGYGTKPNAPAIVMDKPGSGSFGIGAVGQDMVIRYGGADYSTGNWLASADSPLKHYFDGEIYSHNGNKKMATQEYADQVGSATTVRSAFGLECSDIRTPMEPPSYYYGLATNKKQYFTLSARESASIGLPAGVFWLSGLITFAKHHHNSGGAITQIATCDDKLYIRASTSDTTWGEWSGIANKSYVDTAIQAAIQNTWDGSY